VLGEQGGVLAGCRAASEHNRPSPGGHVDTHCARDFKPWACVEYRRHGEDLSVQINDWFTFRLWFHVFVFILASLKV
jgi:hypothetical protein